MYQDLSAVSPVQATNGFTGDINSAPGSPVGRVWNPRAYNRRAIDRASASHAGVPTRVATYEGRKDFPIQVGIPSFASFCSRNPKPPLQHNPPPVHHSHPKPCTPPQSSTEIPSQPLPTFSSPERRGHEARNSPAPVLSHSDADHITPACSIPDPSVCILGNTLPNCLQFLPSPPDVQAAQARIKAFFETEEGYRLFKSDQELVEGFLSARSRYLQPGPHPVQDSPPIITKTTYRGHDRERPQISHQHSTPGDWFSAQPHLPLGFKDSLRKWTSGATLSAPVPEGHAAQRAPWNEMLGLVAEVQGSTFAVAMAVESQHQLADLASMKLATAAKAQSVVLRKTPQILKKPIPSQPEQMQSETMNSSPEPDLQQEKLRVSRNVLRKKRGLQNLRETETTSFSLPFETQSKERETLSTTSPYLLESEINQVSMTETPSNFQQKMRTFYQPTLPTILENDNTQTPRKKNSANPNITFDTLLPMLARTERASAVQPPFWTTSKSKLRIGMSISDLRKLMKRMKLGSKKRRWSADPRYKGYKVPYRISTHGFGKSRQSRWGVRIIGMESESEEGAE